MIHTLEIDSVIIEFGTKRVLQDVYVKLETGQVTGLLGRNGVGKTCLLKIMFGQLNPIDSSLRLDGKVLHNSSRSPDDIMYLPQFNFIPKQLTLKKIFQNFQLNFQLFISDFPDFAKYHETRINGLSSGEQRIVEIYIILMSKTRFCLLDEPFSQVMPIHVESIKKLINREKKNKGILITDHLYEHIVDICVNLYVIKDGKTYLTESSKDLETLGYINSKRI